MSSSIFPRRPWLYGLVLAMPVLAFALEMAFASFSGPVAVVLFLGAVVVAAWQGGIGLGIALALWSALWSMASLLMGAPRPGQRPFDLGNEGSGAVFVTVGMLIALVTSRLRASRAVLAARTRQQEALSRISGLAIAGSPHLFEQTGEICARALEISRAEVWPAANGAATSNSDFCAAVLAACAPLGVEDFGASSLVLPPELREQARAALGVAIGATPLVTPILIAISDQKRLWPVEEREFLSAVAGILAIAASRAAAEVAHQREEARYRTFVEQSAEAIWCFEFSPPLDLSLPQREIIDLAFERGLLTECNDVFARMYGCARARDVTGAHLGEVMARDSEANIAYFGAFIAANCRLNEVEITEFDRDGIPRVFVNNLVGMVEAGELRRVWGTQRDISAQKEAANALRESEARFRALFDAAPNAIAILRDNRLLYVNRAAAELWNCASTAEMMGRAVSDFVAPADSAALREGIEGPNSDQPLIYEATCLPCEGAARPLRLEMAPLLLPDGPATLCFAFDLTGEKAAQIQREELLQRERGAAQRAARLQEITATLARTLSFEEVAQIIVGQGVAALGASSGAFSVPHRDESGAYLEMVASVGYSDEVLRDYQRLPLDNSLPAARAVLKGVPSWLRNQQEAVMAHPIFDSILAQNGIHAICALPLEVEGRTLGALSLSFDREQPFDAETRAFMLTLAGQCAQALDRVRLFNEARDAARMQRESLALLNTLLDCAPIGFAFFDLQGRYVLLNSALAQLSGAPADEHLGRRSGEIGLLGEEIEPMVARVIASGMPSGDLEIVRASVADEAETRHCLLSFYPVSAGNDEVLGVGALVLDISARVESERERVQLLGELEMERARFEAILQQMPSAVVIGEAPGGRILLDNSQVNEIFRHNYVTPSGIEQYSQTRGYHADGHELEAHEWPLARAIEHGEIVRGEEITVRRGDNSMGVIRLNAAPIRDRDGQISAGVVVFDDVTNRARAEAGQRFLAATGSALVSLLDENEIYQRLAELCAEHVAPWCIVAIPDDNGLLAGAAIAHPDAAHEAEAPEIALELRNLLARDARRPWNIEAVLESGQAALKIDHSLEALGEIGVSEAYLPLMERIGVGSAVLTPLSARGRVLGVMIWLSTSKTRQYDELDVQLAEELGRRAGLSADNARLYHEAETARDQAQGANRAKDEFLAVVSHELRTPLTPIMGWLELLRAPGASEELRAQAYDVIERNARAQAQLINDILDVSRITSGKLRLEFRPVALKNLVEGALESFSPAALAKKIEVQCDLQDVGKASLDANRIQQVVGNLLQNALKFTPEGGQIRLELRREGPNALLRVKDSGSGIAPEFLPHVFDRFRQADSSSTRSSGGLGLGLAIVAHIVEGHGGKCRAQSQGLGHGSTFSLELPLIEAAEPLPSLAGLATQNGQKAPRALQNLRILVVDDEADTRDMLQRLLEIHGAQVRAAGSATEALTFETGTFETGFDLLLSDIGMPETDGLALRRLFSQRGYSGPSIALTAYTGPDDVEAARAAGFSRHLAKPVDAAQLLSAIRELTGSAP